MALVCLGEMGLASRMPYPKADVCSIMLFVDKGMMFHKILDHNERFPETSPRLMLSILPFCALTVHDGVRFVRAHFDPHFSGDTQAIARLRNMSKSLSSKGVTLEEYEEQTLTASKSLSAHAKSHGGLFGNILNAMQPSVSFVTCGGMPTAASYVMVHYLGWLDFRADFTHGDRGVRTKTRTD